MNNWKSQIKKGVGEGHHPSSVKRIIILIEE